MLQSVQKILLLGLLAAGVSQANAFSLLGLFADWQTTELSYQLDGDAGGPMNLGDEYRVNTPVLVYGYDPTFLNYFGQDGVVAIEEAIKMINDLPSFSAMSSDLSEFPLDTRRFNYQALALGVRDLRSWALSYVLEQLGLASAERWVFTLRSRVVINDIPLYTTVKRNFDPITLQPSSYVNGTLYSYQIQFFANPDRWEAVEFAVDPIAPSVTSVAGGVLAAAEGTSDTRGVGVLINPGLFYTGLTRDDVGGLRYLYRSSNLNVENVVADGSTTLTGGSTIGGSASPWIPIGGGGTQTGGGAGAGGGAGGVGGGVGGGAVAPATNLVDVALRPGPDKIRMVRANYDSLLGQFTTNSIIITDQYVTNGATRQQILQRAVTQPDIIFTAADLGVNAAGIPVIIRRTMDLVNNSALNSLSSGTLEGPGTVDAGEISFTKVGPSLRNVRETSEVQARELGVVWGKFDGSTNAPVVFPSGLSIQQLEEVVSEGGSLSPWRIVQ